MTKNALKNAAVSEAPQPQRTLRLATVRGVVELEPYRSFLTEFAMRALIFDAEDRYSADGKKIPGNGLAPALIRIGRKILVDLDTFDRWLLARRGRRTPASNYRGCK